MSSMPPFNPTAAEPVSAGAGSREIEAGPAPLCVDLDGTLVATDTLWEGLVQHLGARPWDVVPVLWAGLRGGRGGLKREVAGRAAFDASSLPYRPEVLALVDGAKASGRPVWLVTGAYVGWADAVAGHVGGLTGVIATGSAPAGADGVADDEEDPPAEGSSGVAPLEPGPARERRLINNVGPAKLGAIRERLGERFQYVGDSRADDVVLAAAEAGWLVGRRVGRVRLGGHVQPLGTGGPSRVVALFKALRPHQWAKNLLLFVPLLAGHHVFNGPMWVAATLAFLAFCLTASGVYLLNDLQDLPADRLHPRKRRRPLPAGTLPIPLALLAVPVLWAGAAALAVGVAAAAPPPATGGFAGFAGWLSAYVALTFAYTWRLKAVALLDVLTLAGLYVLRLLAGGAATGVFPSGWLLAFGSFLFLSLAFAKRYVELTTIRAAGRQHTAGRDYHVDDLPLIGVMGLVSGYLSVLVLALYVTSDAVVALYEHPHLLWLATPVALYWFSRLWLRAQRRSLPGDPVVFALTDAPTWVCAAAVIAVAVVAT